MTNLSRLLSCLMSVPDECWVVTSAIAPYEIKLASPSWHTLWKFKVSEVAGKPLGQFLNGKGADLNASATVVADFFREAHSKARCTNTAKDGRCEAHTPHDFNCCSLADLAPSAACACANIMCVRD